MVLELSAVMTLSTIVFLREAQFGGVHAIDIQTHGRIVHVLRNVDLAHARQLSDTAGQILRDVVSGRQIAGVHLNVDRRRHAGIEDRVHHGSALEERAHIRETCAARLFLHAVHVDRGC